MEQTEKCDNKNKRIGGLLQFSRKLHAINNKKISKIFIGIKYTKHNVLKISCFLKITEIFIVIFFNTNNILFWCVAGYNRFYKYYILKYYNEEN